MRNWLRRIVKLVIIIVGLIYLLLNCVLNLPPVRRALHDQITKKSNQPVEIGYLYLNWRFNPTLSSLQIGSENSNNSGSPVIIKLNYFQIQPAWRYLKTAIQETDYLKAIHSLSVGRIEIDMHAIPEPAGVLKKLPELQTTVDSWRYRYISDKSVVLSIGGENLKYYGDDRDIDFGLSVFMGEEIDGTGTISVSPRLEIECSLNEFSFPDRYWMGLDNLWRGRIKFENKKNEGQLFTAELKGSPAAVGGNYFPDVELMAGVAISENKISADTLTVSSDYLYSNWEGLINDGEGRIDLKGKFELDLARLINHYADFYPEQELSAVGPSLIKANLEQKGKITESSMSGEFILEKIKIDAAVFPSNYSLELKNWLGRLGEDGLVWETGMAVMDEYKFVLGTGFSEPEEKGLINSFTGKLMTSNFRPRFLTEKQIELLGEVENINIPLNISFLWMREGFQTAFASREGKVALENISFNDIWMMASYSSQSARGTWFGGNFSDQDGNEWEVSGGTQRPLQFKSKLEQIDGFLELADLDYMKNINTDLRGVELLLQFENPAESWKDYYGYLSFSDAAFELPERNFVLNNINGEVRIIPGGLVFSSIYARRSDGQLHVDGRVDHSGFFKQGSWDLNITGRDIEASDFFTASPEINFRGLDFEVDFGGELYNPDLNFRLSSQSANVRGLALENIVVRGTRKDGELYARAEEVIVAGGRLMAAIQTEPADRLRVDFKAEKIHLDKLLHNIDFMRENIRGPVTVDGQLRGLPSRVESWTGDISVIHSGIYMEKFPDLPNMQRAVDLQEVGKDINIKPATYNLEVSDGKIHLSGVSLAASEKDMKLKVSGYLGLNGELNTTYELELWGDSLASYLQDLIGEVYRKLRLSEERRLTIRFFIRGSLFKPEISLDKDKIEKDFRRDFIESLLSETLGRPINRFFEAVFD
jgi:hypothetical protein